MSEQFKVQCLECENKFWIMRSVDIPPVEPGEAFQSWCPYCSESRWVEIAPEEKKEEKTP